MTKQLKKTSINNLPRVISSRPNTANEITEQVAVRNNHYIITAFSIICTVFHSRELSAGQKLLSLFDLRMTAATNP